MTRIRQTAALEPSPYLTAVEAADWLRFASVHALYKAVKTVGLPVRRRGRTLLFHRDDLDRWLAGADAHGLRREARSRKSIALVHARQSDTSTIPLPSDRK